MHLTKPNSLTITWAALNIGNLAQLNQNMTYRILISPRCGVYDLLAGIFDNSVDPVIKLKSVVTEWYKNVYEPTYSESATSNALFLNEEE